jgi:ABC-type multidrug transport system fused ATPase/permease subunit
MIQVHNININETDVCKKDAIDEETISNINGDIEFDNVSFLYPSRKDVPVLNNITLIAPVGQTIALVGSSGCGMFFLTQTFDDNSFIGKSTCISLLLRYYAPSSGQITINGRSLTDYNLRQLRQNIGVVSQEPVSFLLRSLSF